MTQHWQDQVVNGFLETAHHMPTFNKMTEALQAHLTSSTAKNILEQWEQCNLWRFAGNRFSHLPTVLLRYILSYLEFSHVSTIDRLSRHLRYRSVHHGLWSHIYLHRPRRLFEHELHQLMVSIESHGPHATLIDLAINRCINTQSPSLNLAVFPHLKQLRCTGSASLQWYNLDKCYNLQHIAFPSTMYSSPARTLELASLHKLQNLDLSQLQVTSEGDELEARVPLLRCLSSLTNLEVLALPRMYINNWPVDGGDALRFTKVHTLSMHWSCYERNLNGPSKLPTETILAAYLDHYLSMPMLRVCHVRLRRPRAPHLRVLTSQFGSILRSVHMDAMIVHADDIGFNIDTLLFDALSGWKGLNQLHLDTCYLSSDFFSPCFLHWKVYRSATYIP